MAPAVMRASSLCLSRRTRSTTPSVSLVTQASHSCLTSVTDWPHSRKVFHSVLLSFGTGLASGTCYFLNPSATAISKEIGTTVTQLSRTVSFLMLCMGIASILTTPLARIYGKRPGKSSRYLVSTPVTGAVC